MRKILHNRVLQKFFGAIILCAILQNSASAKLTHHTRIKKNAPFRVAHVRYDDELTGKVTDLAGKPLVDVTVQIKGKPASAVNTDLDGKYTLKAGKGEIIVFKVNRFITQEITYNKDVIDVVLLEDNSPSTTFNVLYGTQKKTTNVSAIGELRTDDLTKTISSPINGTLTGRLAGLITGQQSGEPGGDGVSIGSRGQLPLVILDGIPQSFTSINPEQIESVTLLKDALSTAMMGIRASNGLLLITTKQGFEGPQRITFKAMYGYSRPTEKVRTLDAYNYAQLFNEALVNDGKAPIYSQSDLNAYRDGTDPIGHPNVDWQKEILRNETPYSRYNVDIAGGKKTAKYYVSLDYLNQNGLFKTSADNTNNTNSDYQRYVFRSNVQLDLSKYITSSLNLFGRLQSGNEPGVSTTTLYNSIINTPANAYPIFNSNGSLGGSQDFQQNNVYGQNYESGYRVGYTRDFRVDLNVKADLQKLTKGLYFRALSAINTYLDQITVRSKPLVTFQQGTNTSGATIYTQYGTPGIQSNSLQTLTQNRVFYLQGEFGYEKSIGKNNIEATVLANNDYRMAGADLAYNIRGFAGRFKYNYDEKYLAEVAFAYNGSSERYAKGKGYGLFPAVGLGWNISKEEFLQDQKNWLSNLKLRATFGKTGNFNPGYYTYSQFYSPAVGYNFGQNGTGGGVSGVEQGVIANPELTFEKARKLNIGIDASLFKDRLSITAEYYNNRYYDLLQTIGNSTTITGAQYPDKNIGIRRFSGTEFQVAYNDKVGNVGFSVAPNLSIQNSKVIFQDEPFRQYDYQVRTGLRVGQSFGYQANGLFQSVAEINSSAKPANSSIVPGDIRYVDQNGDGIIDENDQIAIGRQKPVINFGLNLTANWKGFDFAALLQGISNYDVYLGGTSYWAFQGARGQVYEHNLDRWTPQTAATATYPRLTIGSNANNELPSSYWIRKADFFRLKSVELGYSFPVSMVKHIKLSGLRLFVNGTNLFTVSELKNFDPENYFGNYPLQKMLVAGLSVKF